MKKRYIYLIIILILIVSFFIYLFSVPKLEKLSTLHEEEIRVVSYNLEKLKSVDKLIVQLNKIDADIIGFQEVDKDTKNELIKGLEGYEYTTLTDNSDSNPIFYKSDKFNLINYKNVWYSNTKDIESIGFNASTYRYLTWVELQDKKTGTIFNHLNTQFEENYSHADESFKIIKEELVDVDNSIILTGNFMFLEGEHNYSDFKNIGLNDSKYLTVDNVSYSTMNFGFDINFSIIKPVDFIFVSDKSIIVNNYRIDNSQIISNYFPVIVDMEVK